MSTLYIIPARGGSKGIPGKNIKALNGKPLIYYSLDIAKNNAAPEDVICISTDDDAIINKVVDYGFAVDFKRPESLATDNSGTYEVLLHALNFYEEKGHRFNAIVLLQPTSPFRKVSDVTMARALFTPELDMIVSVKETKANPYYLLVEENAAGFLEKSKTSNFTRRQDCPVVYEYNGAIYVINPESLKNQNIGDFTKVRKFVMDEISSVDLDLPLDWDYAEFLLEHHPEMITVI